MSKLLGAAEAMHLLCVSSGQYFIWFLIMLNLDLVGIPLYPVNMWYEKRIYVLFYGARILE